MSKYDPITLDAAALSRLYRAEARDAITSAQDTCTDKPCEIRDEVARYANTLRYRARFCDGVIYHVNRRSGAFRHVLPRAAKVGD